jgi:hypothetical protein
MLIIVLAVVVVVAVIVVVIVFIFHHPPAYSERIPGIAVGPETLLDCHITHALVTASVL